MLVDDIRHSWRRMRARPGTLIAAAAMLALGIGLTTSMFTIADTLLLRPVPFRAPDQLARLSMMGPRGGAYAVSPAVFAAWRNQQLFDAVESADTDNALLEIGGQPLARASALVTPGLLRMLEVRPLLGRLFDDHEGRGGTDDRVLLSEDLWRSALGADPSILNRSITVNGRQMTVIGILPADFRFPAWNTVIWQPIDYSAPAAAAAAERPIAYVRFAEAIPRADAQRLATDAAHQADAATTKLVATPAPLAGLVLDPYYKRAVPMLFGGVALVFVVLCVNVSSLLLVRLTDRRRELGVCSALGASRLRLVRQALVESAVIGLLGAALGTTLAWLLIGSAQGFLPDAFLLRTLNPLNLDPRALAVASLAGMVATLLSGTLPAWIGTRANPGDALRAIDRGGTESRTARSLTRAFAVAEIALACALLVGATLLVRSFANLAGTDRGLVTDNVTTATFSLPPAAFKDAAARAAAIASIEAELRALPGVSRIALSFGLPPDGGSVHFGDDWLSNLPDAAPQNLEVESYAVGADFFDLYGIPLLRGRPFRPADTRDHVIVGERLSALLWPGVDPVGRSFSMGSRRVTVVGLAREIHHPSIDPRTDRPEFYEAIPTTAISRSFFMASLRCQTACPDEAFIRQRLRAANPAIQLARVGPVDREYFEQLAAPRAAAALGAAFASIAVAAAAGGLFGVLSYAVGRRRREFGIRTALGASAGEIRRMVLRDGLATALAGISVGALTGWTLARALSSLQYGVTGSDPFSWLIVVGLLGIATVAAAWLPAAQAARVDPLILMRDE